MAGVMASGGRPSRAYQMLTPLLTATPDSYELNLTRTVALARQHRAREAFDALTILRSLAPDPNGIRRPNASSARNSPRPPSRA
jgi:hypothetical protein